MFLESKRGKTRLFLIIISINLDRKILQLNERVGGLLLRCYENYISDYPKKFQNTHQSQLILHYADYLNHLRRHSRKNK